MKKTLGAALIALTALTGVAQAETTMSSQSLVEAMDGDKGNVLVPVIFVALIIAAMSVKEWE